MYPVDGFVLLRHGKKGSFKILEIVKLYKESPNIYYDLEGLNIFYRHDELLPASKIEDLHDKMTQHLEIEV